MLRRLASLISGELAGVGETRDGGPYQAQAGERRPVPPLGLERDGTDGRLSKVLKRHPPPPGGCPSGGAAAASCPASAGHSDSRACCEVRARPSLSCTPETEVANRILYANGA